MSDVAASGALWYLGRGAGVVSLVLLSLVVVLGILTRGGRALPGLPRFGTHLLHRYTSLLSVVLLAVHIVTAVLDPYVTIRWVDAVVPFGSGYSPVWLGLGALAVDLLIALMVTSLARRRIGRRAWRAVHWAAYLAWPIAVVHAVTMGPDVTSGVLLAVTIACVAASVGVLRWRTRELPGREPVTVAAPDLAVVLVAGGSLKAGAQATPVPGTGARSRLVP
jgi:predicted ferric reductase